MPNLKTQARNIDKLRQRRNHVVRSLNDLYVLVGLTRAALLKMQKHVIETQEKEGVEFEAPSSNGETTTVSRDKAQLCHLLERACTGDIYGQFLVSAVALTEDYLQGMLKVILKWFPQKLILSIDGKPVDKNVGLDLVLKSATIDELLDSVIQKRLLAAFYGSPEQYFNYIESVLSIKIEKDVKDSYAEIKATRDIVVHNSGIANATYILKARKRARARSGESLETDRAYFTDSIQIMKHLAVSVYSKTVKKFGPGGQTANSK